MGLPPVHIIHQYTDDFYKVVTFKRVRDPDQFFFRPAPGEAHDEKLDSAFSRARSMVLQFGLCNDWQFFFTGTLNGSRYDRYGLSAYAGDLTQFVRDQRKKWGAKIQYLFVPERHKDGAWHTHGFLSGLPEDAYCKFEPPAPWSLCNGNFFDYVDYHRKFGFCSIAPIRDPVASAFYICKYIGKDMSGRASDQGQHLYFHSRPLKHAQVASQVYLWHRELEDLCDSENRFCKTGFVDADWTFPLRWDGDDVQPLDRPAPVILDANFDPREIDPFYEQLNFW